MKPLWASCLDESLAWKPYTLAHTMFTLLCTSVVRTKCVRESSALNETPSARWAWRVTSKSVALAAK